MKVVVGELFVDFLNNNQLLTLFVESNESHQSHKYFTTQPPNNGNFVLYTPNNGNFVLHIKNSF